MSVAFEAMWISFSHLVKNHEPRTPLCHLLILNPWREQKSLRSYREVAMLKCTLAEGQDMEATWKPNIISTKAFFLPEVVTMRKISRTKDGVRYIFGFWNVCVCVWCVCVCQDHQFVSFSHKTKSVEFYKQVVFCIFLLRRHVYVCAI